MMKRIIATLLAALLLLAMFAGCSEQSKDSSVTKEETSSESTAKEETSTKTEEPEPVELNLFWAGSGPQQDTDEVLAFMNTQVDEKLPNTSLNWTIVTYSEFKEKYHKALAANEVIDLAWHGWKMNYTTEIAAGNLLALDPYLKEYGQGILNYYGPDVIDLHRYSDGQIYVIPAYQGLLSGKYMLGLRKAVADLFTEAEVEEICTKLKATDYDPSDAATRTIYDTWEEILSRAKDAGVLGAGVRTPMQFTCFNSGDSNWRYAYYTVGLFGHLDYGDETYTVISNFDCEPMKSMFEYAAKWYDLGYIPSDVSTNQNYSWDIGDDSWAIGMVGVTGYADPEAIISEACGQEITLWEVGGPEQVWPGTATGHAVPFTAKNPERAIQFLNLLFTDEGKAIYRTYVFGLEGKHWDYTTDKDTIDLYTGSGDPGGDWAYGNPCWTIGTCENIFKTSFSSPELYSSYKKAEADAYIPPFATFNFDNTNVAIEEAQILAVREEYLTPLSFGLLGEAGWEDYYNELLQKLDAAGINKYLEEVQKQLDEFIENTGAAW